MPASNRSSRSETDYALSTPVSDHNEMEDEPGHGLSVSFSEAAC